MPDLPQVVPNQQGDRQSSRSELPSLVPPVQHFLRLACQGVEDGGNRCGTGGRRPSRRCPRGRPAPRAVLPGLPGHRSGGHPNEADADYACQEGFIAAIERIDSCRNPAQFGGWLFQIVRNRARNLVRHHAVRAAEPLELHEVAGEGSAATELERSELRDRLLSALAELSEAQREVVLLHDLEGWTHG